MKILVTGANGLVGQALCSILDQGGHQIIRAVRISTTPWEVPVGDLNEKTDWSEVLIPSIDAVIHLAGQVPLKDEDVGIQDNLYHQVNTLGTTRFAEQCAKQGVKRFIFVSTVKVLGENKDEPFRSDDLAIPADSYAISKWHAEQLLFQVAAETEMEVVIIRPPLVYGPGVKGNFASMVRWIQKGIPLPLGAINNQRSLVALDNLADFIAFCADRKRSPKAANEVFLISDGEDVSTPELLRKVALAYGVKPRLFPVPVSWMRFAAGLVGKSAVADRLLNSLAVDSSKARELLGWKPVVSMDEQLHKMVKHDAHV